MKDKREEIIKRIIRPPVWSDEVEVDTPTNCISRQQFEYEDALKNLSIEALYAIYEEYEDALKILLEKESEDCVSRQAAIEAMAPFDTNHELRDTLESLPPVKPKAVEDAISKHDLWRIIEDNAYWVTYNETSKEKGMTLTGINQALNECPPVESERPKGEWTNDINYSGWTCTHCNYHDGSRTYNFCPNCGAKMKGEEK